jgi:hypothetical protein
MADAFSSCSWRILESDGCAGLVLGIRTRPATCDATALGPPLNTHCATLVEPRFATPDPTRQRGIPGYLETLTFAAAWSCEFMPLLAAESSVVDRRAGRSRRPRWRIRLLAVLVVGDVFQPVDGSAVDEPLNGDVGHRRISRPTVPMLHAGLGPDDIADGNVLPLSAPLLHPSGARGDDERLTGRMGVPCGPRTRCERDLGGAESAAFVGIEQRLDADVSGEGGRWAGGPAAPRCARPPPRRLARLPTAWTSTARAVRRRPARRRPTESSSCFTPGDRLCRCAAPRIAQGENPGNPLPVRHVR